MATRLAATREKTEIDAAIITRCLMVQSPGMHAAMNEIVGVATRTRTANAIDPRMPMMLQAAKKRLLAKETESKC